MPGPVKCPFCGHLLEAPHRHLVRKHRHPSRGWYLAVYRCPGCGKMFTIARRRVKALLADGDTAFKVILHPLSGEAKVYVVRYRPVRAHPPARATSPGR